MGIEFMTGAVLLSTITVIFYIILAVAAFNLGSKLVSYFVEEKPFKARWELSIFFIVIVGSLFYSSAAAPKLKIETPVNRDLIEYQTGKEVIIVTPPPRSETLEGFEPLKK